MKFKHCIILTTTFISIQLFAQQKTNNVKKKEIPQYKSAVDVSSMDLLVSPTNDFYRYANGTWLKNNPVPSTESRWGNFNLVAERNEKVLRDIVEKLAKTPQTPNTIENKIATFY